VALQASGPSQLPLQWQRGFGFIEPGSRRCGLERNTLRRPAKTILAPENLFDFADIRVRLFHIFLRGLHVTLLQRALREQQFIARHLL